jgi:signal transduction histidine kinase
VIQFAVSGLAVLVLVGLAGFYILRNETKQEAVHDAQELTQILASVEVEPYLNKFLLRSGPKGDGARGEFGGYMESRILNNPQFKDRVVSIKLWNEDGRLIWASDERLLNLKVELGPEEREVLENGGVKAEVTDLSEPENRFEPRDHQLVEVYTPVVEPETGTPLLFEAYVPEAEILANSRRLWAPMVPILIAALALLWLAQVPLAMSLARRLREGQREREALLLRAIDASDAERRRIAADLHDGVVQDLAGITFSLGAAAERTDTATRRELAGTIREAARGTRRSMRLLRSMLVDIYPPNLRTSGLETAISDLLAPLGARGVEATLDVTEAPRSAPAVEQLAFRTAQEALRNVIAHSAATRVDVRLDGGRSTLRLEVEDDGRGFDAGEVAGRREEGHLGLALLADRAADMGGTLVVDSTPGEGTRLRLEVPRG